MDRRHFIKTSGLLSAGTLILPTIACERTPQLGLQIYSVRSAINQDLEKTLEAIAQMGYQLIEHAGYGSGQIYNKPPIEFKNLIESLGMKLVAGHVGLNPDGNEDEWKKIVEANAEAGLEYLVMPSLGGKFRTSVDRLKKSCESFNKIGDICVASGLKFAYHNHAFEFDLLGNDKPMYDILIENTNPETVCMEMDLYWTIKGGADPKDYFSRYPGRFELWHVKDMEEGDEGFFAEVGHGVIDFTSIFKSKKEAGLVHYFVEQDASRRDPMESIKMSADYLIESNF